MPASSESGGAGTGGFVGQRERGLGYGPAATTATATSIGTPSATSTGTSPTTDGLPAGSSSSSSGAAETSQTVPGWRVAEVVSGIQAIQRTVGSPGEGEGDVYSVVRGVKEKVDGVGGVVERVREVVEGIERALGTRDADADVKGGRAKGRGRDADVSLVESAVRKEMKAGLEGIQAKIEEIVKLERNNNSASSDAAFLSTGSAPGPALVELKELRERLEVIGRMEEETQRLVGGVGDGAKERGREVGRDVSTLRASQFLIFFQQK